MRPILLGLIFASLAVAQTPILGAQLRELAVDSDKGTWEAELLNTGSRTITAYFVVIRAFGPDGRTTMAGGTSADFLMNFRTPEERQRMRAAGFPAGPIEPGESISLRRNSFGARGANGESLPFDVALDAVIYDDGAVEGNPQSAEGILSMRRTALKVQEKYVPKLLALRGTADAAESLKIIYREVTDELYELDKDPDRPMNREFGQARGQLNMMQQEIRNLIQAVKHPQSFTRQLERSEQRLERLRGGVK